jgi:hypothetical protein
MKIDAMHCVTAIEYRRPATYVATCLPFRARRYGHYGGMGFAASVDKA